VNEGAFLVFASLLFGEAIQRLLSLFCLIFVLSYLIFNCIRFSLIAERQKAKKRWIASSKKTSSQRRVNASFRRYASLILNLITISSIERQEK